MHVARWSEVYGLTELPIRTTHALHLAKLPDHHRDPFDRILIAQAIVEDMTLISADAKFLGYGVALLW